MQKRGKTEAGTQRWFCVQCSQSHSLGHDTQKKDQLLIRFVAWLMGKRSQTELGLPDRTWRSQISWCWNVIPHAPPNIKAQEIVLLDGIRVGAYVCLIAKTTKFVIAWVWVPWESSMSWSLLLEKILMPLVAVCDGQKGILLAIARSWPNTRVQRCIVHIWRNIQTKLTLHPQTEAGRELLQLTRDLWQIQTMEQACTWQRSLERWKTRYGDLIRERTYYENSRRWWYTHRRLRSAFKQFEKLLKDQQLFTYLESLTTEPIPRTTNHVEGGINSQLRTRLKLHRGLSQTHQMRLVDWYLYSRSEGQKPPRSCR
jgi:hypothetical protein